MALTHSTASTLGSPLPDFRLPGVDGRDWAPSDFQNQRALLVLFMCNHCPYVIAVQDRLNALARTYGPQGFGMIGINSNDTVRYPADSFEAMKVRSAEQGFLFPYVWDQTQDTARAFDAVCTPDPYLYEKTPEGFVLRYRGRIDDSWKDPKQVKRPELAWAIEAILAGNRPEQTQVASMGCNIKWREDSSR
jgi:peroxiredoxin